MSKLFSGKLPCTFWKILILAPVYSSESPRNCVHLCICLPHLGTRRCVISGALNIPGRFDAFELGAVQELAAVCKTRFNVGFDFATILSSPVKCCILFDIASGQLAKLKC